MALFAPAKNPISPLRSMKGDHVGVRVPDYDAALAWYTEKLDFRLTATTEAVGLKWAFLAPADDDSFHIELAAGPGGPGPSGIRRTWRQPSPARLAPLVPAGRQHRGHDYGTGTSRRQDRRRSARIRTQSTARRVLRRSVAQSVRDHPGRVKDRLKSLPRLGRRVPRAIWCPGRNATAMSRSV